MKNEIMPEVKTMTDKKELEKRLSVNAISNILCFEICKRWQICWDECYYDMLYDEFIKKLIR